MDIIATGSASKRRASEPEASEALALISSANPQQNRVPTPLPYLPSDYRPSPDSPRHFVASQHPLIFDVNQTHHQNRRQRSRSIGYPLAIENAAASGSGGSAASSSSAASNAVWSNREHFELVPYREWTVIARNNQKGQLVLYNQDSQSVTVQTYLPDQYTHLDPNVPIQMKTSQENYCPYCHQSMHNVASSSKPKREEPDYMDRNYFRLLASSQTNTAANQLTALCCRASSPAQSRSGTFSTDAERPPPNMTAQNLNANAFNQGYYSKFFVEINKLGKGFRGSVFLCEHMLDSVKLGKYAVKKVAIGNNHPWLVRMLREVHLLERLRHPNIVSYKHSWLEYNRLTPFGPEVPCLFILMECANGGNLEEYFEPIVVKPKEEAAESSSSAHARQKRRLSLKELKRERIRKQYQAQESFEKEQDTTARVTSVPRRLLTMTEIWSLFLDIVQGLAHLHQQNIVHRDLKPPNLLLQYDERNRHGNQGIPRVLISDFGECEDLDETRIDDNRTGATGTLEFMAPEHVRLDPRGRNTVDYSPRADMWSLGMVLYFLCYSRLPYSVIDDVEILRTEILNFKEHVCLANSVQFPASRLDIYRNDPTLYADALSNPKINSDIPNELKMLIRMLLSIDPMKRPSCNEILSKLQSIRWDEKASIFQDIPAEWNAAPTNTASSTASATSGKTSAASIKSPSPLGRSPYVINAEDLALNSKQGEPYTHRGATKHRHSSSSIPDDEGSVSACDNTLRKRQRLLSKEESSKDTIMRESDEEEDEKAEEHIDTPRLLLGSPDLEELQHHWLSDHHSIQIIKIITVVLKDSFGGMSQVIVGQPLDTIKVRLQLDQGRFKGAWDCTVQTVQKEGFFALYKGMASPLIGIGAVNALLFAANSSIKSRLQTHPDQLLPLDKIALAGAGAGFVNSILASPVELLKIKMQAQFGSKSVDGKRYFTGPIDCAKYLIQRDGIAHGLFRGLWATIAREIPAYAGFYTGFEATKRYLTQGQEASVLQLMLSGATGGASYWVCSYPLDVVKSVASIACLKWRDGLGGLFRGFSPTVLRSIPAAGATFTAYELSIRAFQANGW
ncbi:hypothetical protein [Parasitella parasitica]|uniref:non-specific serine/threonine protein kinase n=1 Tax=Parasitella parasitica TaxID=35722 RepID=A0A0B7MSK0_9FUNG|nr:hypothetical protein [Parasitella parasitica]